MELEILKLVFDYSRNGKLADRKFVDKIIEIVVKNRDLHEYVRNIRFVAGINGDANGLTLASYSAIDKNIEVDIPALQFWLSDAKQMGGYALLFNGLEEIMFKNLAITQVILHELEHVFQNKLFDNQSGNPIILKLINASYMSEYIINVIGFQNGDISLQDFLNIMSQKKGLYDKYYNLDPSERLAEIFSHLMIRSVLKSEAKRFPNLYRFRTYSLDKSLVLAYADSKFLGLCPAKVYLDGTNQRKVWTEFDFYDENATQLIKNVNAQYDLAQRLAFGLPISDEEFKESVARLRG